MARLAVHVKGGTGAGCRPPMQQPRNEWVCEHGHRNRGFMQRCTTAGCNVKRPKP